MKTGGPWKGSSGSDLERARDQFKNSKKIVIFSGAGLSSESGVPTFRGAEGLWNNFSPEELANPEAFSKDPELVWEWYQWRRDNLSKCQPNPAHFAIAEFCKKRGAGVSVVTQNVDGLLAQSGVGDVIELHGNIWKVRCTQCNHKREFRGRAFPDMPHCPECKGLERPQIVWFGENLESSTWQKAISASRTCQAMLVVGTSGVVFPAAGLVQMAHQNEAYICGVNLELPPQVDLMDDFFEGKAGEWVPKILGLS